MWFPYVKSTCGHPSTPHTVFPCDELIWYHYCSILHSCKVVLFSNQQKKYSVLNQSKINIFDSKK